MKAFYILRHLTTNLLILLFTYTGVAKLWGISRSLDAFLNQPLPHTWGRILAYAVPVGELIIVILLVWGRETRRIALPAALVLMTVFMTYTALVWMGAFPRVPCSCGGVMESMGWTGHLVLNAVMVALISMTIMTHFDP